MVGELLAEHAVVWIALLMPQDEDTNAFRMNSKENEIRESFEFRPANVCFIKWKAFRILFDLGDLDHQLGVKFVCEFAA